MAFRIIIALTLKPTAQHLTYKFQEFPPIQVSLSLSLSWINKGVREPSFGEKKSPAHSSSGGGLNKESRPGD